VGRASSVRLACAEGGQAEGRGGGGGMAAGGAGGGMRRD
jgi:hypothetical protein